MSWKIKNIFLWFLKVSWIAWRFKITFLKFVKSWNVLETPKYFSMIFISLLDCLKVQNNFPEVWQVLECLGNSKILLYDFQKYLGLPGGPKVVEASECFKIFFYAFTRLLECLEILNNFSEIVEFRMIVQFQNIFL